MMRRGALPFGGAHANTGRMSRSPRPTPGTTGRPAGLPGSDPVIRQAIFTAIDPKLWDKAAFNGTGVLSNNMQATSKGKCYTDLSALLPVPSAEKAKSILLSQGYTVGPNGKLT